MTAWLAFNTGTIETNAIFTISTGIQMGANGPEPTGTTEVTVPVRLKEITQNRGKIIEEQFPGSDSYRFMFFGWVNDATSNTFPDSIRQQNKPIAKCTLPGFGEGKLEFSIGIANPWGSATFGEKFTAIWNPA